MKTKIGFNAPFIFMPLSALIVILAVCLFVFSASPAEAWEAVAACRPASALRGWM